MAAINPLRGEAKVVIAGNEYVLAVTMESLAQLSSNIGDPPFHELYAKLMGGSLSTNRAALGLFVSKGAAADGKSMAAREAAIAAVRDFSLADLSGMQDAMVILLTALTRKSGDEGDEAGKASGAQA